MRGYRVMATLPNSSNRAEELRRAFDRAFAEPHPTKDYNTDDLLCVGVSGDPFALRMSETAGLLVDRKIVPLPSSRTEFLGVLGFRGEIVPVYDLGALLGYDERKAGRWNALVRAENTIALAFGQFEGHAHVARGDIVPAERLGNGPVYIQEVARVGTIIRPIVSIAALLEAINKRDDLPQMIKEEP
ncbi:MAG: chemotaxis protein CheW [Candidatus Hydrogenedentes bacterium]|nr:chemotaxis protein CheW [Candidatus Hydrogenedentota bacterium]